MSDAAKFPLNLARCEFKFAADDVNETTGEFAGYGAVFGNVDSYGDLIAPGAFKSTLADWRKEQKLPPMLLQHGGWMINDTDALPIGKWTKMEEDSKGLRVEGKLINLDTDLGKRVFGAMKEGVLDGMSIGYRAKEWAMGTKPEEPRRTLKAVTLVEVSLVTFPANPLARVTSVKSIGGARDIAELLRAGGLSGRQAKIAAGAAWRAINQDAGDDAKAAAILKSSIESLSRLK